jgi:hypothetical protein
VVKGKKGVRQDGLFLFIKSRLCLFPAVQAWLKPVFYSDWLLGGEKHSKMGGFCTFQKTDFEM